MKDRILVLADDLTGALEAGAKFAGQGIRTLVSTELNLRPKGCDESIGVLVIDAETRHLPAAEAGQRVRELAHAAGEQGFRYLYKKTDSTLRGNIASELGALAEAFPGSALLYVPAYPRMGRTVKRGMLYVHGGAGEVVPKALAARFEALVVFGGDTAYAVLRALDFAALLANA
jgi:uncharacterized protein YgbK (DUF1537 family)